MRSILVLLGTLFLISCDRDDGSQADTAIEQSEDSQSVSVLTNIAPAIDWYDGTIEAAFAYAKAEDRPIFLYWGAVWCPPCQEIKHTVFKSQAFVEMSELFVPVYLDGDTERAQVWGESFGVKGYPTMIVLNPEGVELTRIPGGIDIERYNSVLALALDEMRPTAELITLALDAPDQLRPQDFQQLAYYSWWQDSSAVPEGTDRASLFRQLSEAAPVGPLRARFFMNVLAVLSEDPETILSDADIQMLSDVLSSDVMTLACWDTLAYAAADIVPMVKVTARDALSEQWTTQLFQLRHHPSLSRTEGLAGWVPALELAADDLESAQQLLLSQELRHAEQATTDNYERQSVIYQISEIYRAAAMNAEAKALLLSELERSASPYYFMSGLAGMAEEEGDTEGALNWRQSAWENSMGEATRFQWGVSYIRAMIRLAPDRIVDIQQATDQVINEVDSPEGLFAGRNFSRLKGLKGVMAEWEQSQNLQERGFIDSMAARCVGFDDGSSAKNNCMQLANVDVSTRSH